MAALFLHVSAASAQSHWLIDEPPVSEEATGTTEPFMTEEAPSAEEQMPPELAQAEPEAAREEAQPSTRVDESALRYFASQGDTRRLEIEIARLRALYPHWTPPVDPLAAPVNVDDRLEEIWLLYSEGRLAEARQAITERQEREEGWEPPADLLDRLALSEARQRLLNASEIDQYGTVISIASDNPQLLTCGEVDVLWRVAEAFASTEREARATDAYRYILANCDDAGERLATMQNAGQLLSGAFVDQLLELERFDDSGTGEFASVRDDLARDAVALGDEDPTVIVPADQLARVENLARQGDLASDALLLGWYHIRRENFADAEEWFALAREREDSAEAAEGFALALIERDAFAEAEDVMYPWRNDREEIRAVYFAAVANLLGVEPRPVLSQEVLGRIVEEVVAARDVPSARQLGWYARAWQQHQTARQWFETVLSWDQDDEPSAYGLALSQHVLGDDAGLAETKRLWQGRSERIQEVGSTTTQEAPAPTSAAAAPAPAAATVERDDPSPTPSRAPSAAQTAPAPAVQAAPASRPVARARDCRSGQVNAQALSPQAALDHGWCLMNANRPMEAAQAFEVALRGSSQNVRRDASYGQSLAYLRVGLVDDAAVAASRSEQDPGRAAELQSSILSERALGAFERGRYVETLIALDQRSRIAAERVDLLVLRGYAYLRLNRISDALRVFEAAAATGNRDGLRGLAAAREARRTGFQ